MSRLFICCQLSIDRNISRADTCVCRIATQPSNESGPSVNKPAIQQVNTTAATSPSLIINYISFNCRMCGAVQCHTREESVNHHTHGMLLAAWLLSSSSSSCIEKSSLSLQSLLTILILFLLVEQPATADCVRFQYANIVLDAPTWIYDNRQQSMTFNLCYTSTLCLTNCLLFLLMITDRSMDWTVLHTCHKGAHYVPTMLTRDETFCLFSSSFSTSSSPRCFMSQQRRPPPEHGWVNGDDWRHEVTGCNTAQYSSLTGHSQM